MLNALAITMSRKIFQENMVTIWNKEKRFTLHIATQGPERVLYHKYMPPPGVSICNNIHFFYFVWQNPRGRPMIVGDCLKIGEEEKLLKIKGMLEK